MLEMVVDEVGSQERTREPIRMSGAGVAERIVVVGDHGMFGDTAEPLDHREEGEERHQPQQRIEPPVTRYRENREQDRVGDDRAVQSRPSLVEPQAPWLARLPERTLD